MDLFLSSVRETGLLRGRSSEAISDPLCQSYSEALAA